MPCQVLEGKKDRYDYNSDVLPNRPEVRTLYWDSSWSSQKNSVDVQSASKTMVLCPELQTFAVTAFCINWV